MFDAKALNKLGLIDVTTPRQRKNGSSVWHDLVSDILVHFGPDRGHLKVRTFNGKFDNYKDTKDVVKWGDTTDNNLTQIAVDEVLKQRAKLLAPTSNPNIPMNLEVRKVLKGQPNDLVIELFEWGCGSRDEGPWVTKVYLKLDDRIVEQVESDMNAPFNANNPDPKKYYVHRNRRGEFVLGTVPCGSQKNG